MAQHTNNLPVLWSRFKDLLKQLARQRSTLRAVHKPLKGREVSMQEREADRSTVLASTVEVALTMSDWCLVLKSCVHHRFRS